VRSAMHETTPPRKQAVCHAPYSAADQTAPGGGGSSGGRLGVRNFSARMSWAERLSSSSRNRRLVRNCMAWV